MDKKIYNVAAESAIYINSIITYKKTVRVHKI
jgi:hypothetical protein